MQAVGGPVESGSYALWMMVAASLVIVVVLIALPMLVESYDSNILNGFLVATYISWTTLQLLN